MEGQRRALGEEHLPTLWAMQVVSRVYFAQGKLPETELLRAKVLEGRRRIQGEEHRATRSSMAELAHVYQARGKSAAAINCTSTTWIGTLAMGTP
jgi:hypothetical protein